MGVWVEPRPTGRGGEIRMDRQEGTAKLATGEAKGRNPRWTAGGDRRWRRSGREPVGTAVRSPTGVPDPAAGRYAFLLDKALLICKRRGDSYDLKDFVNLHSFQVRDDSSGDRENKKVGSEARTGLSPCAAQGFPLDL